MFLKPKDMVKKAEEERAKVDFKQAQLKNTQLDRQVTIARRRRAEEIRRLTA